MPPNPPPSPETIERVSGLLRKDLRLGDDAEIGGDTPLLGGDHDLDSLDVLLLVTSVEKEFGIKIPNQAVGAEAFRTVDSLARFVEGRIRNGAPPEGRWQTFLQIREDTVAARQEA